MAKAAPRISQELVEAIALLYDGERSIADIWRGVVDVARDLELAPPSYEQTRVVFHEVRAGAHAPPKWGRVVRAVGKLCGPVPDPQAVGDTLERLS